MYKQLDEKVIVRIDFRPTLKYFDEMFKIASTLEDEFENWRATHKPSMGVLFDKDQKKQLNIQGNSIAFTTKNSELINGIYDEFVRLIALFMSDTGIETVHRIGIRRMALRTKKEEYTDFSEKFFEKFYGSQTELLKISADTVEDVVLILEGVKDGFSTRSNFGPLKQGQLDDIYKMEEFDVEPINIESNVTVLVDTDYFLVEESNFEEAVARLKDAIKLCSSSHNETWKLIEAIK